MRPLKSDALTEVEKILDTGGTALAEATQFDDDVLQQTFEVTDAVRRSRVVGASEGWFYGIFHMIHAAAGDEFAQVTPYNPAANVPVLSSFPTRLKPGHDLWLLGAGLRRNSGAGTLDGAVLLMAVAANSQAWGVDSAASAVVASPSIPLVRWTGLDTGPAGITMGIVGDGSSLGRIITRLPRGCTLSCHSTAAGAAATFQIQLILGAFPTGLGQDIIL